MKIEKLEIKKEKFDINLKFYFFLKYLIKADLTDNQAHTLLKIYFLNIKNYHTEIVEKIREYIENKIKTNSRKQKLLYEIMDEIHTNTDLSLFVFSLKLFIIKDLLLEEAKMQNVFDISRLAHLDPLSLEYDKITLFSPYSTRVTGALLSLIFFDKLNQNNINFMTKTAEDFIYNLSDFAIRLQKKGVEPNQIFMLMFSESINQSIISDSGSNYEDRILTVLKSIGLHENNIQKIHDKNDSSTEFDFFFELNNKTYGIGAKRTLRERYKQFIKTAQMTHLDVMIEITLGVDLTKEKVKSIRSHNVFLFVSNEVYTENSYLQEMDGVFSTKDLTLQTLKRIAVK